MATRARRWLWVGIGCAAALVVLVALAAVGSQSAWFHVWLRDQAVARLASQWNGRIAIGALEGNLVSGLRLRDVGLTLDGRTVAAIDEVEASYNLWSMVTKELSLDELRLRGVDL